MKKQASKGEQVREMRCGRKEGRPGKNKEKAQERKMKENRKPEKERGRVAVSRMSFTRVCPVL